MKVECKTIDQFITELHHDAGSLFGNMVRVRIDRDPEQEEGVSFQIVFHATAVVAKPDGEWLLEFSDVAGCDEGKDMSGSNVAGKWMRSISELAKGKGFEIREGKIEL